jgi:predicted ATPase
MDEQKMQENILSIQRMKESGCFKNYIEYMQFPFYKNLVEHSRINFDFPMTVLIGKNGVGKSSTLHALYGAPKGYTCSDFWFSTEVDPVAEGGINRYFYGYRENFDSSIKEVMKTRMKRGSDTKKIDLDYWETSRPKQKDGMLLSERNSPVDKEVIYLDFRAEVSAFDKIFHFSKEGLEDRKDRLRSRSKYLKRLFENEAMRFPGVADDKMGKMEILSPTVVSIIGSILNKQYVDIRIADHRLFQNYGTSVYMKNKFATGYSEANAGSGEVAVVQLVRRIENASDYALVLLDEPEVSLHPGAQENLKAYLLDVIKKKKLQVIISSHSPVLINGLPNSAIKLYKTNEKGKFYVEENVHYQEAFYDIEDKVSDKKIIYCEDYAAQMLIEKTLVHMKKEKFFEVVYFHGGEKTLINHYMTPITLNTTLSERIFMILDGDMKTDYVFDESILTKKQLEDPKYLADCVKAAFGMDLDVHPDGGRGGKREDQQCEEYLNYLRYYSTNVFYLPNKKIPEEILLESKLVKERFGDILEKYEPVDSKNAKDVVREICISEDGDDQSINHTIKNLANKWSLEDSDARNKLVSDLQVIFDK